jgi:Flp pilus assembly protein TadG
MALVLPIIVALLLGVSDFGRAWLVQQDLTASTREGARIAIAARPVTDGEVVQKVRDYLTEAKVPGAVAVSVSPSAAGAVSGTSIVVTATTSFPLVVLPKTLALRGSAKMVKE